MIKNIIRKYAYILCMLALLVGEQVSTVGCFGPFYQPKEPESLKTYLKKKGIRKKCNLHNKDSNLR